MNPEILPLLRIAGQSARRDELRVFEGGPGEAVVEGVIERGGAWYRIESGILDLLPPELADWTRRREFAKRHGLSLPAEDAPPSSSPASGPAAGGGESDVRAKREQIAFYTENSAAYDDEIHEQSFYVASYRICFDRWLSGLAPGSLVCDIGSGTGRVTLAMAAKGLRVVSTDISEPMLRLSHSRAAEREVASRIDYVLADGENLPLQGGVFDACVCFGALHHVPNPSDLMKGAVRVLKRGGRWLSYDPHRSPLRPLFDWLMRHWPLYNELANEHPQVSRRQMREWCARAGLDADIRTHFFMPPHLLKRVPAPAAERVLDASDALFNGIGLGALGGVIVVSGAQGGPPDPS